MDRARRFRRIAAEENRGRQQMGWRYSARLKALGVAHCRTRREAGGSYTEIARELGITALTLGRWLKSQESATASFRPVEVIAESEVGSSDVAQRGRRLLVVTASGVHIEGLSWPEALELARTLG